MGKINGILQINDILNVYSKDIQNRITDEAVVISNEAKDRLKATSPSSKNKHKGKYKNGWRVKTTKGYGSVECIIHNATSYQLTHLLEHPHLKRNGGMTTPIVHIAPVEQKYNQIYEKKVENIIKNGG